MPVGEVAARPGGGGGVGGMVLGGGGAAAAAAVGGDDAVVMQLAAAAGEESVITVNCPDQAGLGCDICHTILEFGLRITRGGTRSTSPDLLSVSPPRFRALHGIRFTPTLGCLACDSEFVELRERFDFFFFSFLDFSFDFGVVQLTSGIIPDCLFLTGQASFSFLKY